MHADSHQEPWIPQASLVPASTAPLALRVTFSPLAKTIPPSHEPHSLKDLSTDEQEDVILDDLLYVFMGFEGQYIRYSSSYDPSDEQQRLIGPSFRILAGLDPSLKDLTHSMLQMATHYTAVEAFVHMQSRGDFGLVCHALCAAIRRQLKNYLMLTAQLETQLLSNPGFTLHVLHLHTLPMSHTLLQLYSLAQDLLKRNQKLKEIEVEEDWEDPVKAAETLTPGALLRKRIFRGGDVLRVLTERLTSLSGDPAARSLLQTLLREASRPYTNMLNEWLHKGVINDPHSEFAVKEQKNFKRENLDQDYTDEYWEKRYTLREDKQETLPPQLESVKMRVLLAGKYLNVVRECGGVNVSTKVKDIPKTFDDPMFLENINQAYTHANASLLNLLLTRNSLTIRLRSLKHYFFLDRSDFFTYFLDMANHDLKRSVKSVNVGKLQSLLDLAIRQPGTIAAQDPFKEDVKVTMNEVGLVNWLLMVVGVTGMEPGEAAIDSYRPATVNAFRDGDQEINGFEGLELDYAVPFPLSLVISRKTVLRYQLLFRYLLSLRHLESVLGTSWTEQTKVQAWIHRSSNPRIEILKRRAWTLRARMLVFVQQVLYFCTAEVIEPNWNRLMDRVNGSTKDSQDSGDGNRAQAANRTVDELIQDHVDFLDTCLKECMLTQGKLLKVSPFSTLHSGITLLT